jgi:hypothetical protein
MSVRPMIRWFARNAEFTPQVGSSCRRPEVRADIRRGLVFAAVLLLSAYLGLTAIWAGLGLLVTGPLADSWMGTVDQDVAGWLVAHRTPVLDDWSRLGTMPADTRVKIIATAIIAAVMPIAWRSWREPFLVCFSLILEAAVFITVTGIVGRPHPDVAQLDQVSVTPASRPGTPPQRRRTAPSPS